MVDINDDPWVEDQESPKTQEDPRERDVPQPEIQQVPTSREPEMPPMTPEDVERLEREQRRKIWQPPRAEA